MNWSLVMAWAMWIFWQNFVKFLIVLVGGTVLAYYQSKETEKIDKIRQVCKELGAFLILVICLCLWYGIYKVQHPGP